MVDLSNPIYRDDAAAREHLEAIRWPNGPFCPRCGSFDSVVRLNGKSEGWLHCRACRKRFSVMVGTVFERSHIPLSKWLLASHLMAASKKGVSAHQLHRMLGVTYKTAWFMAHRLREAMRELNPDPLGGPGQPVEVDEAYYGGKVPPPIVDDRGKVRKPRGWHHKEKIVALVERGGPRPLPSCRQCHGR